MTSARPSPVREQRYRILLAEGAEVVRRGLTSIIGAASRFVVCAATGDYEQVEELMRRHRPHLLIVEPFHDSRDGIIWIRHLSSEFRKTKILVASSNAEANYAERALRAGALGYWMKDGTAAGLLEAVDTVLAGEFYFSSRFAIQAVHKLIDGPRDCANGLDNLSDRELHVFFLIAADHGIGQIAQELCISRKTVETHCEHIKLKLNYRDAVALKRGARESLGKVQVA